MTFPRPEALFGFVRFILKRMARLRLPQVAGSLTFTTLLALVPLFTIALTVFSAFPAFSEYSTRFKILLLTTLVPEFAGKVITVYMRQFAENAAGLTLVGVVFLGATSVMLMSTVERTFNAIWSVNKPRPLLQQTMIYWMVLSLGPILLGGGLLSWRWLFKVTRFEQVSPLLDQAIQIGGSVLLTTLVLSLLLRIVPNRFVPLSHAALGGGLTAVLLELMRALFGLYIGQMGSYQTIYGAFASIPIFLLWLYLLWMVLLVGASFTASLSYWEGQAWCRRNEPRRRFLDALEVMVLLDAAQASGRAVSPQALRREIAVGYDELGRVLDRLSAAHMVLATQSGDWVLSRKLSAVTMAELFQLFVYRGDAADDNLAEAVDSLFQPFVDQLDNTTLADFALRVVQK
ncbi:YihY family inner membrane protein [Craterilacuibacter sp.]|uniref:YihY family inner membrane protein n=1 Tax=Craterilacuibacter sp. TaxID=2870909 RepID=UPI003F391A85